MDSLIITLLAAGISTLIWYIKSPGNNYRLGILSLFYWGTTIMVFIDHLIGSIIEKSNFLEIKPTPEGWVLSSAMIIAPFAIWTIILVIIDPKRAWKKR